MAFYDKFPYTNFQEINLDKLIIKMLQLELEQKEFINNNVIKYANPIGWSITSQYEANTVVTDSKGNAYISSQPVPAGVDITNTAYWSKIGNFEELYSDIKKAITAADEGASTTASAARAVGDLVWVNDDLLKITAPMIAGDSYVIGSNCEVTDIENELKALDAGMVNLTEYVNTSVSEMREYVEQTIEALPEFPTPETFGAKGDGTTNDTAAFVALRDYCLNNNVKCYIPNKTYRLENNIVFDSSLIVSNGATFTNKRLFTNGTHIANFVVTYDSVISKMAGIQGTYSGYGLQACCYNPVSDTIIIGLSNDTSTSVLVELSKTFSVIRRVTGDFGHINDMTFNEARQTLFIAPGGVGGNANKLIEVDPTSLTVINTFDLDYPGYAKWHVAYDNESNIMIASNYTTQWFVDADTMQVFDITEINYKEVDTVAVIMQNSFFQDGKLYTISFADNGLFNYYFTSYNFSKETQEHDQTMQGTNSAIEIEGSYVINDRRYMLASDGTDLILFNCYDETIQKGFMVESISKAGYTLTDENIDYLKGVGVYACRNSTVAAQLRGNVPFNKERGFIMRVEACGWRATIQRALIVDGTEWYRTFNPDTDTWSEWRLSRPLTYRYNAGAVLGNSYRDITQTFLDALDYIPVVIPTLATGSDVPRYATAEVVVQAVSKTGFTLRIFNYSANQLDPGVMAMVI